MTKAALIMLTRAWARELGPHRIRVNAIAPGLIQTDFSEYLWKDPKPGGRNLPAARCFPHLGQPDEVGGGGAVPGQRRGSFVTGQVLVVDGGVAGLHPPRSRPDDRRHERGPDGPEPPPPTVWAAVKEAVRGAHRHDYTAGPIGRALMLLAVPMVLEVALESVFAVVNVFWVGRLGPGAIATVGLTEAMFSCIYALGMGLGIGATAMVARRIGEKNPEGAARAAVQAIALGVLVAIPIGVLGGVFAPRSARGSWARAPDVVATRSGYTRVLFSGNVVILLLFLINAIFRGAGDAAIAMRSLWIANICNMILDPLLIFGIGPFPELGVMGAAVATTVGRGMGVVYQFYRLTGRDNRFAIQRHHLKLDPPLMGQLIRLSGTGIFQILIGTTSWIGLVRVVSTFGSQALAGYTVARPDHHVRDPAGWGMSNAAATMVGQALGAGKPERAEQAVWRAGFYNLCFLGVVGSLFVARGAGRW